MRAVLRVSGGRRDILRLRDLLGEDAQSLKTSGPNTCERKTRTMSETSRHLARLYSPIACTYADISETEQRNWGYLLIGLTISASFLAAMLGSIVPLAIPFLLYGSQIYVIERRGQKRQMEFDRDYPALLMSLASGIKTGLDPLIALTQSAQLFQKSSIMCSELESINTALQEGLSEDSAIARFGSRVRHPDIRLFRMAFALARKEGASLSYCLQRLARVTRQRQSFRRKTRGAVAMQKLSAFGIAGCTLLIGAIQGVTNRGAFVEAFMHPIGRVLLILGLVLVGVGIIWMLRMAKIRV